jgi:hypothetical protein
VGCAAVAYFGRRPAVRLLAVGGSGAAVLLAVQLALPQRVVDAIAPVTALERLAPVSADAIVVADASLFGTAAWAFDREDIYVVSAGEIEYGLSYPASRHRWLKDGMLADLIAASRDRHEVIVLCTRKDEPGIAAQLPATASREELGKVVLFRIPR